MVRVEKDSRMERVHHELRMFVIHSVRYTSEVIFKSETTENAAEEEADALVYVTNKECT